MLKAKNIFNAKRVKYLVTPHTNQLFCLLNRSSFFTSSKRKSLDVCYKLVFWDDLITASRTIQSLTKCLEK